MNEGHGVSGGRVENTTTSTLELSRVNEQIHNFSQDQSSHATVDKYASIEHQVAVLLDPWGPSDVRIIHAHVLKRVQKVYVNTYHLFSPASNNRLACLRIGGAFHSAIELKGLEYAFGGHPDEFKGIYDTKPLWKLREEEMKKIDALGLKGKDRKKAEAERLVLKPPLKERRVLGTWAGTDSEWEQILGSLHAERNWKGPQYRLLSRNCNDFVCDMAALLERSSSFKRAPGFSEKSLAYLFQLPKSVRRLCCCLPIISDSLDELMPPAPVAADVFKGQPRRLREPRRPASAAASECIQSPLPTPLRASSAVESRNASSTGPVELNDSSASAWCQSPPRRSSDGVIAPSGVAVRVSEDSSYQIHDGMLRLLSAEVDTERAGRAPRLTDSSWHSASGEEPQQQDKDDNRYVQNVSADICVM